MPNVAGVRHVQEFPGPWYRLTESSITTTGTGSAITMTEGVSTITAGHTIVWHRWNEAATVTTTTAIWTGWVEEYVARNQEVPEMVESSGDGSSSIENAQSALDELNGRRQAREDFRPGDPVITPEQARELGRQARATMEAHRVKADGERSLARDKARQILLRHLTDRQQVDLASNGYFELALVRKSGERVRYRIHRGRAGNVRRLDEQGREVRRYCIHPVIACPDEDTMLTQKLWLENDEELFLRTANAS